MWQSTVIFFAWLLPSGLLSLVLAFPPESGNREAQHNSELTLLGGIGLILFIMGLGVFCTMQYAAQFDWPPIP